MIAELEFDEARALLLNAVSPLETERIALEAAAGRVLAEQLIAAENVPSFDRSPYDGYAFRSEDCQNASPETPVTLRILEEIPAGGVSHCPVMAGTAVKILTGAPIPTGADCVEMYENTSFNAESVTIYAPKKSGENIICAGEDVKIGSSLAGAGTLIDPGLAGTLAAQGIAMPKVFKKPRVALISTGSELVEAAEIPGPGMIRNSNRHTLTAALLSLGCEISYLGIAGDSAEDIAARIQKGLASCDGVILSGGVSVGDYDKTPAAMEKANCEILFRNVKLKPGGACCYGVRNGKPVVGLSGNPASAMTNFCAIAASALRKMAGMAQYEPKLCSLILADDFNKKSMQTRLLRGTLELALDGVKLRLPREQGNVIISSMIGTNAMAIVPAGSGKLSAGTVLKGFLL